MDRQEKFTLFARGVSHGGTPVGAPFTKLNTTVPSVVDGGKREAVWSFFVMTLLIW